MNILVEGGKVEDWASLLHFRLRSHGCCVTTHRAEEPRVDDPRPRETLEEHLDAEHEDGGVGGDGGGQPGAR